MLTIFKVEISIKSFYIYGCRSEEAFPQTSRSRSSPPVAGTPLGAAVTYRNENTAAWWLKSALTQAGISSCFGFGA